MKLNHNTRLPQEPAEKPLAYALHALRRDMARTLCTTDAPGGEICLRRDPALPPECFCLDADANILTLSAADVLGFVYGLFEISRRFLGVQPFWFWNDQTFSPRTEVEIPGVFHYASTPARVRYRGWFINDETLLSHWKVNGSVEEPFRMAFEALLRCGGNMVIPGTGTEGLKHRQTAADMGLILTHHHAEPLGAPLFVQRHPDLEAKFSQYPDLFRALWQEGIDEQKDLRVVWNIGFRGQGDRPFWADDPQYDSAEARGSLLSALIREQYDLVKQTDPQAVCCTNLYGEMMELYRSGNLELPDDVIRVWADNGYGKMVSRRQNNENSRIPSLPQNGDAGRHGLYYHVSFYDLQAASHITMLPNSAELVCRELTQALACGADDYWIINCSNIKPHVYLLDYVAQLWRDGAANTAQHRRQYAGSYYGGEQPDRVAADLAAYAQAAVAYGPHEDEHAGDQFYNHVPRMLISQFLDDPRHPAERLRWLCDLPSLLEQVRFCAEKFATAQTGYEQYLRQCEMTAALLSGAPRRLYQDSLLLQAQLYAYWADGALNICRALQAGADHVWKDCFYFAGKAKHWYALAYRAMTDREHGKWVAFYANECQTDIRQTAQLCGYLMSYARNKGEGPHFHSWMQEFGESAEESRVQLLLNTEKHPTDEALFALMEARRGE